MIRLNFHKREGLFPHHVNPGDEIGSALPTVKAQLPRNAIVKTIAISPAADRKNKRTLLSIQKAKFEQLGWTDPEIYYNVFLDWQEASLRAMSPDTIDPQWPVGYPYEAIARYDREDGKHIALQKGDKGYILNKPSNGWIRVTRIRGSVTGYVPIISITPGNVRRYGDIAFVDKQPQRLEARPAGASLSSSPGFRKHVTGLLEAISAHRGVLHFLPQWFIHGVDENDFIRDVSGRIVDGVRQAGLLDLLNQDDFSAQQLRDTAIPLRSRSGIYLILYEDFENEPSRPGAPYVGQTVSMTQRNKDHLNVMHYQKSPLYNSIHYRTARKAKKRTMFPLCMLPVQTEYLDTAEQIFISLLETYREEVTASVIKDDEAVDTVKAAYIRWKDDRDAASLMAQVAEQAKSQTHWPGGCSRASFGARGGLNWKSPLGGESDDTKVVWTKITTPEGVAHFRRTPSTIAEGKWPTLLNIQGDQHFKITRPRSWTEPEAGNKAYAILELMPKGQDHPVPFARHPRVGPYNDWAEAFRIGLRVEWQREDGSWWQNYCHNEGQWQFSDNSAPGSFRSYTSAMALIRYICMERVHHPPSWYFNYGIPRIKEPRFDWLSQTVNVYPLEQAQHPVPRAAALTLDQVGDQLKALGAEKVGTEFAVFLPEDTPQFTRPGRLRATQGLPGDTRQRMNSCDGCWVGKWSEGKDVVPATGWACRRIPGTQHCIRCKEAGRPCTWTRTPQLESNTPLVLALRFARPFQGDPVQIADPDIETLRA